MSDVLDDAPTASLASYDARLAQRILAGDDDAVALAVTLFERHDPPTLSRAVELVRTYGDFAPGVFDRISQAYDMHRHLRNMPCD